jgi:hypothetical protein
VVSIRRKDAGMVSIEATIYGGGIIPYWSAAASLEHQNCMRITPLLAWLLRRVRGAVYSTYVVPVWRDGKSIKVPKNSRCIFPDYRTFETIEQIDVIPSSHCNVAAIR